MPPTEIDQNKYEIFHRNDESASNAAAAPEVIGDQANVHDEVQPQDELQDPKPGSLVHKLTLHGSDSETNILYQGSVQELSTFTPTKDNVLGETGEEWMIRLNKADVSTCLWQHEKVSRS